MASRRPRGFAPWNPKTETVELLRLVNRVLEEYREFLPLTVRQVFYRLVGQYGYDKTEKAYARLGEHIVRARRAMIIPFDSIRDDGTVARVPQTFDGVGDFWAGVRHDLSYYSRDRLEGQAVRLELWCEAAGMVPQLQRVAFPYSVPVYSTGGFSSVTVTREIAQRALSRDVDTVFLHVGDYDPSGQSIFDSMTADAQAFVWQGVAWRGTTMNGWRFPEVAEVDFLAERVALTEEQVADYGLPTAPPKATDTRSRNWYGETCQAEALPPSLLARLVREAIEGAIDMERFERERQREAADRAEIREGLETIGQ